MADGMSPNGKAQSSKPLECGPVEMLLCRGAAWPVDAQDPRGGRDDFAPFILAQLLGLRDEGPPRIAARPRIAKRDFAKQRQPHAAFVGGEQGIGKPEYR